MTGNLENNPSVKWKMQFEPLVPTGYFFGKIEDGVISDKTYDKCIAWVEKNKDNPERLSVADNIFDSKYEDIIIPDTVQCFQDVIVHIDDIILEFTKGQLELEGVWAQHMETGSSTALHAHVSPFDGVNQHDLSFVFYLQADESHGEIKFPLNIDGVAYTKTFFPNRGGLIVFPSHCPHFVIRNKSKTPRVVISGNYRKKGCRERAKLFLEHQEKLKEIENGASS